MDEAINQMLQQLDASPNDKGNREQLVQALMVQQGCSRATAMMLTRPSTRRAWHQRATEARQRNKRVIVVAFDPLQPDAIGWLS